MFKSLVLLLPLFLTSMAFAQAKKKYDSFYPDAPSAKESFMCSMADSAGCRPISEETLAELDLCAENTNIGGPISSIGYLLMNRYADSVFFQEMAIRSHWATKCQLTMLESDNRAPLKDAAWAVYQTLSPLIEVLLAKRKAEEEKMSVYSSRALTFGELKRSEYGYVPGGENTKAIADIDHAIASLFEQIPFGGQEEIRKKMAQTVLSKPSKAQFTQAYDLALANLAPKYREAEKSFSDVQNKKTGEYNLSFSHKTELYKGPGARDFLKRVDPQEKSLVCRFDACFEKGPRNVRIGSFILLAGATVMTLGSASPFLVAAASAGAVAMSASAVQDSCFKDTLNVTGQAINSCSAQTLADTTISQMSKVQCAVDAALLALDAVPGLALIKRATTARLAARAGASDEAAQLMSQEARTVASTSRTAKVAKVVEEAEPAQIVISSGVSRTQVRAINGTLDKLGKGQDDAKLLGEFGYKKQDFSADGVSIFKKEGSPDIILPDKKRGFKLNDDEKDHLFGILSGKDPDKFVHPKVANWKLEEVSGKVDPEDLAQVQGKLGKKWEDPEVRKYFEDELKDLEVLPLKQREQKLTLLVNRAKNWDSPLNAPYRLIAKSRQARYTRDFARYRSKYMKENPSAKAGDADRFAVQSARLRRDRLAKLGKQCRSFKPNSATKEAGKIFAKYSVGVGTGMTMVNYTMANLKLLDEDAPTFAKRLGFEVTATVIMSLLGSKIASNPSSTYLKKYIQNNLVSLGGNIPEALIYQYFLGGDEAEARAKLEEIQKSPTFDQDMKDLIAYLENRSEIQEAVDHYDDKIKEMIGVLTGNPDFTEKDLANLDQKALENPEVQEKILDVIADDLYNDKMDGMTSGSSGVDRLLYNTTWNAGSNAVNVGISVAIFQAVCSNLDSPAKALAIFSGATIARSTGFGYLYFKGRTETINQ